MNNVEDNEIDPFTDVKDSFKVADARFYQVLLFCISSFGIIIGFSKWINPILIPMMLSMILTISTFIARSNKRGMNMMSVHMKHLVSDKKYILSYDKFYFWFFNPIPVKRNWFKQIIEKTFRISENPFLWLMVFCFIFEFYIIRKIFHQYWSQYWSVEFLLFFVYLLFLIILNIYILWLNCKIITQNIEFFKREYDKYQNQMTSRKNG